MPAKRCTLFFFLLSLLFGCLSKEDREVQRSFYYWKTSFRLSPTETSWLDSLSVNRLHLRLFDLAWNEETGSVRPLAKSLITEPPPSNLLVTPVVFITNESLARTPAAGIDSLAFRTARLMGSMTQRLRLSAEVQIDCDWTATTRDRYFQLLRTLRQTPFFQGKELSVTIRLHQLKYLSQNGVPPADRGLLMAYNMGNLRHPETRNSIIDPGELKKYVRHLEDYPLPMDLALPLFDWYVLFRQNTYAGLVHRLEGDSLLKAAGKTIFRQDTVIGGYAFRRGDWLRHEGSDPAVVKTVANLLSQRVKNRKLTVILYHLDEYHLNKYQPHELESFFRSFR